MKRYYCAQGSEDSWQPAAGSAGASQSQALQAETRNNASQPVPGTQSPALPGEGLVAAERLAKPALSEDEDGSPCETPLGPLFAAGLDSISSPCDELTEMLR